MSEACFSTSRQRLVERVIQQHVVVGASRLKEGLDARHVGVERTEVVPPCVLRIELNARVELPARPRISNRRIRSAVVDDVIDAGDEESVDRGAHVGEPHPEVLTKPCRGFG
jgi:hypothetical protein